MKLSQATAKLEYILRTNISAEKRRNIAATLERFQHARAASLAAPAPGMDQGPADPELGPVIEGAIKRWSRK